jgi:hypothetical protein
MRLGRGAAAAVLISLTIGAAAALGLPDPGRAVAFLTGSSLTSDTMFALIAALCWTAIGLVVLATALNAMRPFRRPANRLTPRTRAAVVLIVGAIALGVGVARHQAGYQVCCSTPTSTQQAEHLVH